MKPAEKYRAWKAHRPEKPIFRTILFSMMAVLLAEVILLSTGIGLTNVSGRLNQNAKQIVNMQVRNRASYLQDMLIKAQELTDISTTINNLTQQMLQDGTISLDTMDQSSEAADPLMEAAAPYLVSALRARPVTGIFLVINTHDLAEKEVGSPMPSIYLRDLDPDARPSDPQHRPDAGAFQRGGGQGAGHHHRQKLEHRPELPRLDQRRLCAHRVPDRLGG